MRLSILEAGFNNSGVPEYARSDTPAIRPAVPEPVSNSQLSGFQSLRQCRTDAKRLFSVSDQQEFIGRRFHYADEPDVVYEISAVSDTTVWGKFVDKPVKYKVKRNTKLSWCGLSKTVPI